MTYASENCKAGRDARTEIDGLRAQMHYMMSGLEREAKRLRLLIDRLQQQVDSLAADIRAANERAADEALELDLELEELERGDD